MLDNNRLKRQIEISLMDALMLARGALIAANTAMMAQRPKAEERLRQYQAMFEELVPEAARVFSGEVWAELGMAMEVAQSIHVTLEPPPWRQGLWHGGHITVIVTSAGETSETAPVLRFTSLSSEHEQGSPALEAVRDVLAELAPIECDVTFDAPTDRRLAW